MKYVVVKLRVGWLRRDLAFDSFSHMSPCASVHSLPLKGSFPVVLGLLIPLSLPVPCLFLELPMRP